MKLVPIDSVKELDSATIENLNYILKSCSKEGMPVVCEAGLMCDIECIGAIYATKVLFDKDSIYYDIDKNIEVYVEGFEYKQPEEITIKDIKKVPVLAKSEERCKGLALMFPDRECIELILSQK